MLAPILTLTLALVAQAPGSVGPVSAIKITPAVIAELDMSALKGTPRQLAWSPDTAQLYVQTVELNKDNSIKATHHYLLPVSGGVPKSVDAQPDWATNYWDWKSGRWAPDDENFAIELEQTAKRVTATSTPMGGDYAKGGGSGGDSRSGGQGQSMESASAAAQQSQTVQVFSLMLKGQAVGVWENERPVPGLTFGWGPKGSNMIVFADSKSSGALTFMDKTGARKKIDGTRDVLLPAWTVDGGRVAYLVNHAKGKYSVVIGTLSR